MHAVLRSRAMTAGEGPEPSSAGSRPAVPPIRRSGIKRGAHGRNRTPIRRLRGGCTGIVRRGRELEDPVGLEPTTSDLKGRRSGTELRVRWCAAPDLNRETRGLSAIRLPITSAAPGGGLARIRTGISGLGFPGAFHCTTRPGGPCRNRTRPGGFRGAAPSQRMGPVLALPEGLEPPPSRFVAGRPVR